MRLRRGSLLYVAVAMALASAGCAGQAPPASPGAPREPSPFEARARQVADAWAAADISEAWKTGFVPLQERTIAPEAGFPADGQLKVAFESGWFKTNAELPDKPGTGTIKFPDGATMQVPLLSAKAAYQLIDQGDAECSDCKELVVTGATLGTSQLRTSRGLADVPVWHFTIEGLDQPVGYVAVAPETIKSTPRPLDPPLTGGEGMVGAHNLLAVRDNTIEYNLGVGACDKEITGMFWESDDVVVIGGSVKPPGPTQACTMQLVMHPVQVTLTKPVGTRVILDAGTGQPVPLP